MEDFFFAFEVEVDSSIGDPRFTCNVGDFGIEVAVVCKNGNSCAQNRLTLIASGRSNGVDGTGGTHGLCLVLSTLLSRLRGVFDSRKLVHKRNQEQRSKHKDQL